MFQVAFVQNLMRITPTTHFVTNDEAMLFRGAGMTVAPPSFIAVPLIGCEFLRIALNRLRKSISQLV